MNLRLFLVLLLSLSTFNPIADANELSQPSISTKSDALTEASLPAAFIKCSPDANINANDNGDQIQIIEGQLLIVSRRQMIVHCKNSTLSLGRNAVVEVTYRDGVLKVHDLAMSPVRASINGFVFEMIIGHEIVLADSLAELQQAAQSDAIQRRRASIVQFSNNQKLLRCEYAPLSLLKTSPILRELVHANDQSRRSIGDRLVKSTASLAIATAGHGRFLIVAPAIPQIASEAH